MSKPCTALVKYEPPPAPWRDSLRALIQAWLIREAYLKAMRDYGFPF